MAKTYCMCQGMRGEATRRGGKDGVHVAAQSYDGSIIVRNRYTEDDKLEVNVSVNDGSSCYSDWSTPQFVGSYEEFKSLLQLHSDIKAGRASVVHHRKIKDE